MPILPQFTAPIGDAPAFGGRRATGEDFAGTDLTGVGKTVRGFVDSFVSDIEDKESRAALVASTEIRAKYAKALDEAALSGGDLGALQESMSADLAKVGEQFQTKRGIDSLALYTANTNLMYDEQANAVKVRRAGAVARVEGSKFLNNASANIIRNPAYLPMAEKDAEAFGATLNGISPEQRAEIVDGLKKELNQAAAIAATRDDPEGAKRRLEAGEWNLTADGRQAAINKAETELRAKRADEQYQKAEARREKAERNEAAYDTHLKQLLDGKGDKVWRRAVMDDPALEPQTREHLILLRERRAKELAGEEKRSNQGVLRDLWGQAAGGTLFSNEKVIAAVNRGDLNVRDASFISNVIAGQKDENGRTFTSRLSQRLSVVQGAMRSSPVYQAQPELAAAVQMEMVSQVERKAAELRKAGTDPDNLLNPDSKDYYFTPNRMRLVAEDIKTKGAPQLPKVTTKAERDALSPDTPYIGPDGLPARTPKVTPGRTSSGKIN